MIYRRDDILNGVPYKNVLEMSFESAEYKKLVGDRKKEKKRQDLFATTGKWD